MKLSKGFSWVAVAMIMLFTLLSVSILPVDAATPALAATAGGLTITKTKVNLSMGVVTTGGALVVVEWFGTTYNPCNYFGTPNDTLTNTFTALVCVNDGVAGGMKAFYAVSSGTGSDTVSCKWSANSTGYVDSCYAFYATNPGRIFVPQTATGHSTVLLVPSFTPVAGSLLLATGGIQQFCQPVGVPADYSAYSPSSECYSSAYGLSGMSASNWPSGGITSALMTVSLSSVWSEIVVEIDPGAPVTTSTTTGTATCPINTTCTTYIQGWLVPDATHLTNSLLLIVLPLGTMGFVSMMGKAFHMKGDTGVYVALFGLFLGTGIAFLGNGPSLNNAIPFFDFVVCGLLLFLWWWNS